MKKIVYTLLLTLGMQQLSAQSSLVFFTEAGEKFNLFVNGHQVNESSQARVTATDIASDFAQIKVQFDVDGAPELKQNLLIDANRLMTSVIKKNKKGRYVFREVSSVPLDQTQTIKVTEARDTSPTTSTSPAIATHTMAEHQTDPAGLDINLSAGENGLNLSLNTNMNFSAQADIDQNTQVAGRRSSMPNEISARVDGKRIILEDGRVFNFKYVRINGLGVKVEVLNPVGSQAIISYDGQEAYNSEIPFIYDERDYKKTSVYFKLEVIEPSVRWSVKLKHYNVNMIIIAGSGATSTPTQTQPKPTVTNNGCTKMSSEGFSRATKSIETKSFSEEKMTVFKQVARSHCMSVSQIKRFMELFTYEEGKLAVAKLSFAKCTNKQNYYELNDALTYSTSVDELNEFLENQ